MKIVSAFIALAFVFSGPLFAQTSNATLGGTVADASGALIPGVSVTATNTGTAIVTTVLTNEAGAYQFASLQTGTYKVTAELSGFQTQAYNNVTLGVSQQVRLNFTLQIGGVAQSVEVTEAADTLIATSSSSVGSVLPDTKVKDLPLGMNNVMDLLLTTPGAGPAGASVSGYFAGGRLSAVNTTRDGFVVSDGRYDFGAFSATFVSPDLVEEVRVVTAPVDAEASRGSGQVQMVTRSGTNAFRGSVFYTNRNSALDASQWFNNFNAVGKNWENETQFGGRLGGPIIKNKTFFFILVDDQRDILKQTFVGTVLTPQARAGIFRFFPGVDNGNAISNAPTVDRNGNPVQPAKATGPFQSFNVFARDPIRTGYDPSGFLQNTLLSRMPPPNDYTVGDGLNTAGIRFTQRVSGQDLANGNGYDTNRDQINIRGDHNFNAKHKFSVIYTYERDLDMTSQAGITNWPGGFNGANDKWPRVLNFSVVSTLSSTLVNEARVGYRNSSISSWAPWYVGRTGDSEGNPGTQGLQALKLLPVSNGIPFQPVTTLFPSNFLNWSAGDGSTRGGVSPLYSYGDTVSWTKGKHAFKVGGEYRRTSSDGWNDSNFTPQAIFGAGGVPVTGIDSTSIPGLSGNNQTTARNLLTDLSGSVASIAEGFDLRSPSNLKFLGYADGVKLKKRYWLNNEFSGFLKDNWKIRPALTLNLGIHYDWYGVPYEMNGLAARPTGGSSGLCGISCGGLTSVEFVGKNSIQPNKQLFQDSWNNIGPAVGFSWSIPWFGKDKTVLRAGYGWSYTNNNLKNVPGNLTAIAGAIPGTFEGSGTNGVSYTTASYLSMASVSLPIPQQYAPLRPDPLNGTRSDTMQAYADNRKTPYIQNFNFAIQRELTPTLTVDVGYVGTKGTRLYGGIPLNTVNVNAALPGGQTFLDAFNATRAGGNAPLFDQMLNGLNLGLGPINGTTVSGSASLRNNTLFKTALANGAAATLAQTLNNSTTVTNQGGGLVRNSGLFPEHFFELNPQFGSVILNSNPGSSTYHSLQIQFTKRLSHGITSSTSYTWSRALGENDADASVDYRNPNDRGLDKRLLGFHRTSYITSNGTVELPFGQNRAFLGSAPAAIQRIVERWQFGSVFSWISGAPLTVTAPLGTFNQATTQATPMLVGPFPKSSGSVTKLANGVTYFANLQQVSDPAVSNVTSANGLNGSFSNKAILSSQGQPVLLNPGPGQIGSLGLDYIQGPRSLGLDMNLIKRVRIDESKDFEFRVVATNVLNHPIFGSPDLNINSLTFGRITTATGNRRFTMTARLNF
jgi:hypothetical protein